MLVDDAGVVHVGQDLQRGGRRRNRDLESSTSKIDALPEWLLAIDHEDPLSVQAGHGVGRRRASLDARVERVRQKSLHEVLAESVMLRQRPQAEP